MKSNSQHAERLRELANSEHRKAEVYETLSNSMSPLSSQNLHECAKTAEACRAMAAALLAGAEALENEQCLRKELAQTEFNYQTMKGYRDALFDDAQATSIKLTQALEAIESAKAALKKASKFISYARYELEPETLPGRQFPSQPEADEHIEMITAALARLEEK